MWLPIAITNSYHVLNPFFPRKAIPTSSNFTMIWLCRFLFLECLYIFWFCIKVILVRKLAFLINFLKEFLQNKYNFCLKCLIPITCEAVWPLRCFSKVHNILLQMIFILILLWQENMLCTVLRGCRMAPMSPNNSGYGSPGKRLRQVDFWPTPHCGEIFPRFGLPKVIGSDNGPAFVSQVSQLVARLLGINWKLHCAYRPQSSGQVERINRTIKETLSKLTLETGTRHWVQLLPMVLFRVRNTPARHGLTPYEVLYGGPPPVTDLLDSALDPLANTPGLQDRLKALQIIQHQIWKPLAAV
ncbi:unnamed protein product [Nyctereutes procyonoides]|uniref:(raccoon dog) hypothetical protein n=1 Tax=Nyctereutes procyonoides TaxID=34880 RepID=A0A811YIB7_NYCPR|nr:unnamed protein product [Nyctereutes procyonoides]